MGRGKCPPEIAKQCYFYEQTGRCFTDEHHLAYPRSDYRSRLEKQYRELPENRVQLPRCEHSEIHATERPPEKPFHEEMRAAVALSKLALREVAA